MCISVFAFDSDEARNMGDLNRGRLVGTVDNSESFQLMLQEQRDYLDLFFAYFLPSGEQTTYPDAIKYLGGSELDF